MLDLADGWSPKALPLSGDDVLACGDARGPAVGAALSAVEHWWVEGIFTADRAACLARLDVEISRVS